MAVLSSTSTAAVYDEMTDGNLSSNHLSPTPFAVTPGSNTIKGGLTASWDYVTFTVPAGYVFSSLTLDSFSHNGGASNVSIFGIAPGSSSPIAPPGGTATGLLGWTYFNANFIGMNLLPTIATPSNGSTGFKGPLPAGTYTFWIQDYSETITYQFSFDLEQSTPPVVKVTGKKKITVTENKVVLKGKIVGKVDKVTYRVGTKGAFKPAQGTSAWKIKAARLKPGKNVITIQATGIFGTTSTKVTVTFKK